MRRRTLTPALVLSLAASLLLALGVGPTMAGASGTGDGTKPALVGDPSKLVRPLDGTGTGPVAPGAIGEFPGADVPFGMMQWSPDTTPDTVGSGGGYSRADSQLSGFSLTHLSGTGCASYGDVPILPTAGPVGPDPASTTAGFSHATEQAAPGRYGVVLGSPPISTELATTTRTGISRFTFPRTASANVLFKVGDSANPATASKVVVSGHNVISGQVTSGGFCGTGTGYTLYFSARFDRPFSSSGSWSGTTVSPGTPACAGPTCGAYVTFNTTEDPVVLMKVGISFVSDHDAAVNLADEDPGWSLGHVEALATSRWNALLGRARIGGGTTAQQHTFYTALYHSLLFPNVVSDDDGAYLGPDGRVHDAGPGAHYANFSEWDIYRSEIELVSIVDRGAAGAMVQSLVDDATQGGWLPKWAIVDGDESQMNGDSADPIIASAYAFGVRGFDTRKALAAMVKGATRNETGHGLEIERQYLSQYLAQHYIDAGSLDLTSIDYSMGASGTLEYALDDFAIARMAAALGNRSVEQSMMQRAHNWEYLFDPSTGSLQGRNDDGSFPPGPAFQTSRLEAGGEIGFEEGNAVQYTWSTPQDLSALAALLGGNAAAVRVLDAYVSQLNVGRDHPFDWSGNEPSLGAPWEFDYLGAPFRTQAVVRAIATSLYADGPVDEPGNDDLGALSSWYVWAAMGLYPVTPGSADLALASPLFPKVDLTLPDGHHLVTTAPAASATTPYVHSLEVTGVARSAASVCRSTPSSPRATATGWCQPWLPASVVATGGTLTYGLSDTPDPGWAAAPTASPPSYGTGRLPAVGFTIPDGETTVALHQPGTLRLGVQSAQAAPSRVEWQATGTGLNVSPGGGQLESGPAEGTPPTQVLIISASTPGDHRLQIRLRTAQGVALPPVDVEVQVTG